MNKAEKAAEVSSLSQKLVRAKAVILAEYRGLKVSEITEIRREVKKNAGELKVMKNRLAKRAIAGSPWASLEKYFKGPLAIIVSEQDPVVVSKILSKFAESFAPLKLKAGFMDGRLLEASALAAIAQLPSREELYAKLLGTLMAPASGVVRTLKGVPQKLVVALKAIGEKKQ